MSQLTQRVDYCELKPSVLGLAAIHIDEHHPVVRTPHIQAVVSRLPHHIGGPSRRGACNICVPIKNVYKNVYKICTKWVQNGYKMGTKWVQNVHKMGTKCVLRSYPLLEQPVLDCLGRMDVLPAPCVFVIVFVFVFVFVFIIT